MEQFLQSAFRLQSDLEAFVRTPAKADKNGHPVDDSPKFFELVKQATMLKTEHKDLESSLTQVQRAQLEHGLAALKRKDRRFYELIFESPKSVDSRNGVEAFLRGDSDTLRGYDAR